MLNRSLEGGAARDLFDFTAIASYVLIRAGRQAGV